MKKTTRITTTRIKQISTSAATILLTSMSVQAASNFKPIAPCGSATVISGDTCSNVKVEFNFQGCEHQSEPKIAKRIICEGHTIKARYQIADYKYEAQFEKIDHGNGKVDWKPLSGVVQYKNQKANAVAANHTEAAPTPTPTAAQLQTPRTPSTDEHSTAGSASPFKFSGFADLRYSTFTTKDDPQTTSGHPESGFGLEDGAFYANYEKNNLSAVLDIAFRRSKDIDTNSSASKPNESSNGNFAIGYDKSQLYLKYKLNSMFSVDFGQFDTIYGVELNDSKDRIFGKTGILYDSMLPVTHTGAMLEFSVNGIYVKAFAANPNNKGSNGSSTAGDTNTEYGGAVGYSNDMIRGQVGYMSRAIDKASGSGQANRTLADVTLGTTLGAFSLDLEYSLLSDPNKNTLTTTDNTDLENPGQAMLALASYKFNDAFLFGLRYENIKDDPTAASIQSTNSYGASIHYRESSELELRTEYIAYDSKGLNGNTWKDSRFNVAALLMF